MLWQIWKISELAEFLRIPFYKDTSMIIPSVANMLQNKDIRKSLHPKKIVSTKFYVNRGVVKPTAT